MSRGPALAAVIAAGALIGACAEPQRAPKGLTARGGELVLSTGDGRTLRSRDLLGATLTVGGVKVRLDAIEPGTLPARSRAGRDPGPSKPATGYLLHHFTRLDAGGGEAEFCTPDPEGRRWALPFLDEKGQVYLSCTAGAIGKCARWGYWPEDPETRELHEACTRMARADYGGDGATATRDHTAIKFCDRLGVFPCDDGQGAFEAAWSREGAVCVARPRQPDLATLDQLEARYPRLKGHLGEAACTFTAARSDPRALIFGFAP